MRTPKSTSPTHEPIKLRRQARAFVRICSPSATARSPAFLSRRRRFGRRAGRERHRSPHPPSATPSRQSEDLLILIGSEFARRRLEAASIEFGLSHARRQTRPALGLRQQRAAQPTWACCPDLLPGYTTLGDSPAFAEYKALSPQRVSARTCSKCSTPPQPANLSALLRRRRQPGPPLRNRPGTSLKGHVLSSWFKTCS